jgi:hypothetical protein
MRFYLINLHVILIKCLLSGLFTITVVCVVLLMAGVGISSDLNNPARGAGSEPVGDVNDANGPTVMLSYSRRTFEKNPISSFMYFIPLISPTLVDRETIANNEQQTGIISYKRTVTSNSFYVTCEFEILGKGFHKVTFDLAGMIETHTGELKQGESLINMLDYIKFEGEGFGRIEVKGTITGSTETVTEVNMKFNARGQKSPVTIGLYDIKPKDGEYKYENRLNQIVARVNSLIFKKSSNPRMGMKLASINKAEKSDTFVGSAKGLIANLFISPTEVTKLGNDTMLDFGCTLLKQKPVFTFPKAKNIKESRMVEITNTQNNYVAKSEH